MQPEQEKWAILAVVALVLIACALTSFFVYDNVQKTLNGQIVTRTAAGFHYYTPLHGGVSFDYPARYINVLDRLGDAKPTFTLLTNNPAVSTVLLIDPWQDNNSLVSVTIKSDKSDNSGFSEDQCNSQIADYANQFPPFENASYEWVNAGGKSVCLIGLPLTTRNGTIYTISSGCGESSIGISGPNKAVVLGIFASMRCGKDAFFLNNSSSSDELLDRSFSLYASECSGPDCDTLQRTIASSAAYSLQSRITARTGKAQITINDCLQDYEQESSRPYELSICIFGAAKILNDSQACYYLPNSNEVDACLSGLAYYTGQPALCDQMGEEGDPSQGLTGNLIKQTNKARCYFHLGAIAADQTSCEKGKQLLLQVVSSIPASVRAQYQSNLSLLGAGTPDECLSQVAIKTKDSALCAKTQDKARDWCQYRIAHPAPSTYYCSDEVVLYLNDNYWADSIRWLAQEDDGATVLSWWDYGSNLDCAGLHSVISLNHTNTDLITQVAYLYTRGSENELAGFMRAQGAKYAIFSVEETGNRYANGFAFGGKYSALNYLGCVWLNKTDADKMPSASVCEQENQPEKVVLVNHNQGSCQPDNRSDYRGQLAYRLESGPSYNLQTKSTPSYCVAAYQGANDEYPSFDFYVLDARQPSGVLKQSPAIWAMYPDASQAVLTALYPSASLSEAPPSSSVFYNSLQYRAFVLGELDGFTLVHDTPYIRIFKLN